MKPYEEKTTLPNADIDKEDISDTMWNFWNNKAPENDGIPPLIVKTAGQEVVKSCGTGLERKVSSNKMVAFT